MKDYFMRTFLTLTYFLTLFLIGRTPCVASGGTSEKFSWMVVDTNFVNVADTVTLQIADCAATASLCIMLSEDERPFYQLSANSAPYILGIEDCDIDTTLRYLTVDLVTNGPYNLVSWNINGNNVATNNAFTDLADLLNLMNTLDPSGNWTLDVVNEIFSGGSAANVYSDIIVFEVPNNTPQTLPIDENYFANGTMIKFPQGTTNFVVTESNTGLKDTFVVNVACVTNDTIQLNLSISDVALECFDYSELPGQPVSVTFVCPANSGFVSNSLLVNGDSCLLITTVAEGTDIYCIEICDDLGVCDTTTYVVNVSIPGTPGTNTYYDTLLVGDGALYCISTGALTGAPDTFYNICAAGSGESVNFFLNQNNFCVYYSAVDIGQDSACIVICDVNGICDTTVMVVTAQTIAASFIYDTVFLNTSEIFCDFDLSELPGNLIGISNACAGNTQGFVDFTVNTLTNCISYEGLAVGKDTACIYLTDDLGNQDTAYLVVCALEPISETIVDTIRLDLTVIYCLDPSQLGGIVADTVFFCDPLPDNITLTPVAGSLCFNATGDVLGDESFCVYICDDLGYCDTTYFQIHITDEIPLEAPTAVADIDTTLANTTLVTNVCDNDIIPDNTLTTFYVLSVDDGGIGPTDGQAFVNDECIITYIPNPDFCGSSDAYSYVICNSAGCDTAFVNIFVSCTPEPPAELFVHNGISPNNDQVNDLWKIQGIEAYPNNVVTVFNRWGSEVLKINGYSNDNDKAWNGTWQGLDLPDGVYYYLINLGVEDSAVLTGWLVISR
jgi:gliding motility-associated-like protein